MGKQYDQLDIDERCELYRLHEAGQSSPGGFVKLTDHRLFSAFLHEAKPLELHIAAIRELPRIRSESG